MTGIRYELREHNARRRAERRNELFGRALFVLVVGYLVGSAMGVLP